MNFTQRFAAYLVFVSLSLSSVQAAEERPPIELGAPFRDNAILQRGRPVPVWGWSKPRTRVTVQFAGQKKSATAAENGKWILELEQLEASFEPRELEVSDNRGKRVTLKNILIGEVWLASGQSNMQWKVQKSSSSLLRVEPKGASRRSVSSK